MKRFLSTPLALCLILLLCACAANQTQTTPGTDPAVPESSLTAAPEGTEPDIQSYPYSERKYGCYGEGKKIIGKLYTPDTDQEKLPLVIICHGMNATYASLEYLASQVASRGMICYIFDFCGGSSTSSSTGSMKDMSVLTERDDLLLVIENLKQLENVDAGNIYLCGWSQGGYVSAATATYCPDEIQGVVLLAPAFHIGDFVHSTYSSLDEIPEQTNMGGMIMGRPYFADIWEYDIYEEMPKYEGPVVIMHGDQDADVHYSYSERAADTFPNAELTVMPGTTHLFSSEEFDLFADIIRNMVWG